METKKVYAELTEEEIRDLRLATILKSEWYEVIDTVCGNARSHKRGNLSPRVGDFSQLKKGRTEIGALPVSPRITPTGPGSQLQFAEGDPPGVTRSSPAGSPAAQVISGTPEVGSTSRKQVVSYRCCDVDLKT